MRRKGVAFRQYVRQSEHGQIARAAIVVLAFTVLVKVVSLLRESIVARTFGVSDSIDAYVIAFVPLAIASNLAAAFNGALIPAFHRVLRREGVDPANQLVRQILWPLMKVLFGGTVVLALLGSPLLWLFAPGFSREKHALVYRLYLEMLPIIACSGAAAIWAAVLNAKGKFAAAALTPVAVPVVVMCAVTAGGGRHGADALAIGTALGFLLHSSVLAFVLRQNGIAVSPQLTSRSAEVPTVMRAYWPLAGGALLLSSSTMVDQVMASFLPAGNVAALNYGTRIAGQATSLIAVAIGTAVLPAFSRMTAAKDWDALSKSIKLFGGVILLITVPLTLLLYLESKTLVSLLYERGAFTSADADRVAFVQSMSVLQVPFYTLGILFVKVISAMSKNNVLLIGNIFSVTLNAVLDYLLMRRIGVGGIALSTSIVYACICCFLGLAVLRALKHRASLRELSGAGGIGLIQPADVL